MNKRQRCTEIREFETCQKGTRHHQNELLELELFYLQHNSSACIHPPLLHSFSTQIIVLIDFELWMSTHFLLPLSPITVLSEKLDARWWHRRDISHLESLMMLFLLHFSLFFETFDVLCWGGKWHLIIIRGAVNPSKRSRQWTTRDTPNFLCRSVPSSDSFLFLWFVSQKSKRIRSKTISDHCFYSLSHTFPHSPHRSRMASCRTE